MHALIIEDESMVAAIIEYVLRESGFETFDIVSSSREAVAAAAERCPDLITVDVTLAAGNGIEAIQAICPGPSLPVIFITGRNPAAVRAKMSEYAVLSKPFSEQTLTYVVAASLSAHQPV